MLSRFLSRSAGALVLTFMLALAPTAAQAQSPEYLSEELTDTAGVVSNPSEVIAALDELADNTEYQLFVVFVNSFGSMTPYDWAEETAVTSNLGRNDILLAVAVEDRAYQVSVDAAIALSDSQLARVESDYIEPELRSDDWAGAAIAAAKGYQDVTTSSGGSSSTPADFKFPTTILWVLLGLIVAAGLAVLGVILHRKSKEKKAVDELDAEASSLLVEVDNAVNSSAYELGYAEAQFGKDAIGEFVSVIDNSKTLLAQAFEIRQKLDDEIPEKLPERREMLEGIITRAKKIDQALDAQTEAFADLRDLHANAPELIDNLIKAIDAGLTKVSSVESELDGIRGSYEPGPLTELTAQSSGARKRFEAASKLSEEAKASLDERLKAVEAYQKAEDLTAQGVELLNAFKVTLEQLQEAPSLIAAQVRSVESDLSDAERLDRRGGAASEVQAAKAAIKTASSSKAARDPLNALDTLVKAEAKLDRVLDPMREHEARLIRSRQNLERSLAPTESSLRRVAATINANRSDVSSGARTRLSEADRAFMEARSLADSDPISAWSTLERAMSLVSDADRRARSDISSAESRRAVSYSYGTGVGSGWGSSSSFGGGSSFGSSSSRRGGGGGFSSSRSSSGGSRRGGGGRF